MLHTHTHPYTHKHTHTHTHTHILTHTLRCKCGLRHAKIRRMCASGVSSRCNRPDAISDRGRDDRAMADSVSRYVTAAGPLGGRKRKGENPTGEFSVGSTVSCPRRRVRGMVKRCCSCTQHSTCSTTACPLEHVNAATPASSVWGSNAGVSVIIRGGLCRP